MDIKSLPEEQLLENIELFKDRLETANDYIHDSSDPIVVDTLRQKLNEYTRVLRTLNGELQRRIKEKEIINLLDSEEEDLINIEDSFPDLNYVFKTKHFQRVVSNSIDQDYDSKTDLIIEVTNNAKKASIKLMLGYKSGILHKRSKDRLFYRGDEPDYDFELYFKNKEIVKIIIYQSKSGANFVYT